MHEDLTFYRLTLFQKTLKSFLRHSFRWWCFQASIFWSKPRLNAKCWTCKGSLLLRQRFIFPSLRIWWDEKPASVSPVQGESKSKTLIRLLLTKAEISTSSMEHLGPWGRSALNFKTLRLHVFWGKHLNPFLLKTKFTIVPSQCK